MQAASTAPKRRLVLMLMEGGGVHGRHTAEAYSGYIRYVTSSTKLLQSAGYDVLFGTVRGRTPLHGEVENLGCTTFALDAESGRAYPMAIRRLRRLIRSRRPHIVHLHEPIQGMVGGLATLGMRGRPVRLYHRHHTRVNRLIDIFSRIAAKLADRIMCVSIATASSAREVDKAPARKLCLAYNGVPEPRPVAREEIDDLRSELGFATDERVVLAVGHLRTDKGQDVLMTAIPSVQSEQPIRVVFVGDGPALGALKRQAAHEGLSVYFAGHEVDVWPWYALSDVVVVPSRKESFGLVAVEAMAAGKPVVASNVGGLVEILSDGGGYLVPREDPAELAQAISGLLSSPEASARLAAAGRRSYEGRFTAAAMVHSWVACYESSSD